jgi:hypothetical protein
LDELFPVHGASMVRTNEYVNNFICKNSLRSSSACCTFNSSTAKRPSRPIQGEPTGWRKRFQALSADAVDVRAMNRAAAW